MLEFCTEAVLAFAKRVSRGDQHMGGDREAGDMLARTVMSIVRRVMEYDAIAMRQRSLH